MSCPMRHLVRERCIVVIVIGEQLDRRHGDAIGSRLVIGIASLMPHLCGNRCEECIELRALSGRCDGLDDRGRTEPGRQGVDLVGIEHRVGLEYAARFFALLAGLRVLDLFGVTLVKDRDGRLLALADLAAQFPGLPIRHPVGRSEPAHVGNEPEPEHIDPLIGNTAGAHRARQRHAAPGLDPGPGPFLEALDDFSGDALRG